MVKERKSIMPVKLLELQTLAEKYQIYLNIRDMGGDDGYKEVHISRAGMKAYPWRKFIPRLKAAGFVLIAGQGQWFGVLDKSGKKWETGLNRETLIPA